MANEQNLIQNQARTEHEKKQLWSKAGKESGKARRENKSVKDIFQKLLTTDLSQQQTQQILRQFPGLENDEINYKTAIGIEQIRKAIKGDMNAAKFIFDYAGEKPKENINVETKLPIFNIEVTDNKELEKEFEKYDE